MMDNKRPNVNDPSAKPHETSSLRSAEADLSLDQIKSITTMNVSPRSSPLELMLNDMPPAIAPDTVAIHLPGQENPFTFHNRDEITLGRSGSSSLSLPDIDIVGREGVLLGVSRSHAVIRRNDNTYYIHDLNSTNGTWHNGKKLIPDHPYKLNSGDQIRLGEQLLFIYFSSTGKRIEHTLYLKDRTRINTEDLKTGVSIPYLFDKVGPFLRTLANVQHTLDEAQNLPTEITVQQVSTHKNGQWLKIKFQGIDPAIKELGRKIYRLREESQQQLQWRGEEQKIYHVVAHEMISAAASELSGERLDELVQRLGDYIADVVASDFEIIS